MKGVLFRAENRVSANDSQKFPLPTHFTTRGRMLATLSFAFATCSDYLRLWKLQTKRAVQSKEDVDFYILSSNTKFKKHELRNYFRDFKKACPSGLLSASTFEEVYRKHYPKSKIHSFCQKAFKSFDTDNDGQIDFVDFVLALDIITSKSRKKKFDWFFRLSDTDKNGVIDQTEFNDVCHSVNGLLNIKQIPPRFTQNISLYDRQNKGFLTKDEFLRMCQQDEIFKRLIFRSCKSD